ncbi:hypothetical protein J0H58_19430 [bacterium]|nr:hypothetical protein [bacterium]
MRWTATLAAFAAAVGLCAAQQPPVQPANHRHHHVPADGTAGRAKVCVYEPQKTTKTVYTTVCKEYCAPDYSPLAVLRRCLGLNPCDGPCPPEPLVKTVLVKKSVPGPDKMTCVLKELPVVCPPVTTGPAQPGTLPVPVK